MSEGLNKLEAGIREKVIRSGAYAGAELFYRIMRRNAPVDEGTLQASIYHWHDDKRSNRSRHIYVIGPNKVEAPHWYNVEFGHWRINKIVRVGGRWIATRERLPTPVWTAAVPYIRPTWFEGQSTVIAVMTARMRERLKEVIAEIPA
jgi:hypothetical protein